MGERQWKPQALPQPLSQRLDDEHQHRRFANVDDVTDSLGNLRLERRKKDRRSRSLKNDTTDSSNNNSPKMPFIPFQRVLHRRRTTLPPANIKQGSSKPSTQVGAKRPSTSSVTISEIPPPEADSSCEDAPDPAPSSPSH
nr:uncharacterized protein LOC128702626 [Cherax quadricarinatus]